MKTNAARILEGLGIAYTLQEYEVDPEDPDGWGKGGGIKRTRLVHRHLCPCCCASRLHQNW